MPFMHFRIPDTRYQDAPPSPRGGATIYYEDNGDGTITFSGARCSLKDNFKKKIAHQVAYGRFRYSVNIAEFTGTADEFKDFVVEEMGVHGYMCYSKKRRDARFNGQTLESAAKKETLDESIQRLFKADFDAIARSAP